VAQARDKGFARWQRRVMTTLTLMDAFRAFAVLSGLPMFFSSSQAKIGRQTPRTNSKPSSNE
jgi:hypothetical protein